MSSSKISTKSSREEGSAVRFWSPILGEYFIFILTEIFVPDNGGYLVSKDTFHSRE